MLSSNNKEDRQFTFKCVTLNPVFHLINCHWTGWTNYDGQYDREINYNCPNWGFIRAFESIHDNGAEDRLWKWLCCTLDYRPTANPTKKPTVNPTKKPTVNPTKNPTRSPTHPNIST